MAFRSGRRHLLGQDDWRTPDRLGSQVGEDIFLTVYVSGIGLGQRPGRYRRVRSHAVPALRLLSAARRHSSVAGLLRTVGISRGNRAGNFLVLDGGRARK